MGSCPKCKFDVAISDAICPKCGVSLAGSQESSGTLNAEQHFQRTDETMQSPDSPGSTLPSPPGGESGDSGGTLDLKDLNAPLPQSVKSSQQSKTETDNDLAAQDSYSSATLQFQGFAKEVSDPETSDSSATLQFQGVAKEVSDSQNSDSSETLLFPGAIQEGSLGEKSSNTEKFGEADLRAALGQGDSGSEGQLMRVWGAAIGSSGRDSKQSLRYERAEASDSVFRRVATRHIADANSDKTEGADYQIQDKLGDGGMGVVYSALQTAVNRVVAIKTRKAGKGEDEASRKQFFYEAEVTAELDHPNIPPIYELGRTEDGTFFYAMKLIRGLEWQKLLRKKTREENLEIFEKVADAVAFAHSKNVIHRDLKPDNVMLGTFGEVYLSDWGLAVNQSKRKEVDFGGTPEFMAPEMARNQRDRIGKHSDIYLLGAILFQVVTGTPPHMGRTQWDRLKAAIQNDITPTDKEDPLLEIARRAMETDPNDRYATVADMQDAIREVKTHADSIALAARSEELLDSAAKSQDYDRFARSIFGFRNALEMWDGNKIALTGLQKARFGYGQCAFDRGDYDLAIQTLDRSIPNENEVFEKATKAKLAVVQRESRFKTLRTAFVAAVSVLLVAVTVALFIANGYRRDAEGNLKTANAAKDAALASEAKAKEEEGKARSAESAAKEAEGNAKTSAQKAKEEEKNARNAEKLAKEAEGNAKTSAQKAKEEEKNARNAEKLAKEAEGAALESAKKEKIQRGIAQGRAAQNRISSSIAEMGRANSSTVQFDSQTANDLLKKIEDLSGTEFTQTIEDVETPNVNVPKFNTFAWQRVNLLTNQDLPKLVALGDVTAFDFAPVAHVGILGTRNGQVQLLRYDAEGLRVVGEPEKFDGSSILCAAISPSGDEAMFSLSDGTNSSTYVWSLKDGSKPAKAEALGSKNFQSISYSPDGQRVVVGVKRGIRVLDRNTNWMDATSKQIDKTRNIEEIRGDLEAIQWLSPKSALASTKTDQTVSLFELELDSLTCTFFDSASLPKNLTAAAMLGKSGRILLASDDGKLRVGNVNADKSKTMSTLSVENIRDLPTAHRASITSLVIREDGRILSISDKEPVVHVWRSSAQGEVAYETYLTGVPSSNPNVRRAVFASTESVLGVDGVGTTFVWNIQRQEQRRKLNRISDAGPVEYPSPVVGIYGRENSANAVSVTKDGAIDLWNLQTGQTNRVDGAERFSYFGHTPGSAFVDSVVDVPSGILVTSALLKKAEPRYLKNPDHEWEFCVWEQATGNMIKRWSMYAPLLDPNDPSKGRESIAPRMTMLNQGTEFLIASDKQTLVYSIAGERLMLANQEKLGTYFAVPNPKDSSLVAMVKRSGLVWLWNRTDDKSWWENDSKNLVVPSREDEGGPLKGIWNEDGSRFFLVMSSGFVKAYDKNDFQKPMLAIATDEAGKPQPALKIADHHDIDLAVVRVSDSVDRLVLNTRLLLGTETKSIAYSVDARADQLVASKMEEFKGLTWLDTSNTTNPRVSNRVHPAFKLNLNGKDSVLARQKSGAQTFVSTKAGTVYFLADDATTLSSIGPQELKSSSSDRNGSVVMLLRADGSLLRMDLNAEGSGQLVRAKFTAKDFDVIQLSPNGKQLAMIDTDAHLLKVVDSASGDLIQENSNVAAISWDPKADSALAIVDNNGKSEITGMDEALVLKTLTLEGDWKVKSVHFFNEAWQTGGATRHLLVQSERDNNGTLEGQLEFVALDPALDKGRKPFGVKGGITISASPVDSVFVTGDDAGTVTVWFASPTWDDPGKVFDLEGHRGAKIECIAFGEDGRTLVTSDRNNRLYGWLSKDTTSNPVK